MEVCGETMLANAIVISAVNDYRMALSGKKVRYSYAHPHQIVENFFRSDYFKILTRLDGESFLRQLREDFHERGCQRAKIEYK